MKITKWCLVMVMLTVSSPLRAQDTDPLLASADIALTFEDSLSIFRLIDSLLSLEQLTASSQLGVRLFYNSNVLWAGRTLGINHFGLAPGLSYYHKSGLFADFSTYWSRDFDPKHYLTILSGGYMHSFSSKFSFIASYDRYFYHMDDVYIPYTNSVSVAPFIDLKPVTFRADYTFFFGEKTTHRVMPSLGLLLQKKGLLKIDKISFNPAAYLLMGNETITEIIFREEWVVAAYIQMQQGQPWYKIESKNVFGIMNYSFMFPLAVSHKKWNFSLSYAYNIPRALPGETLLLSDSGFLAASVAYFIDLKSKKSLL